jgi:hypothetical protein
VARARDFPQPRAGYEGKTASWGATTRCASRTLTACRTSFSAVTERMLPEARRRRITREGDAQNAGKGALDAPVRAGRAPACRTGRPPARTPNDPGSGCALAVYPTKKKSRPSGGATLLKNRAVMGKTLLTWADEPREVPTT